jgi:hypothetical protein
VANGSLAGLGWTVLRAALATATAITLFLLANLVGPWVESHWFPVYQNWRIVRVERLGEEASRIWVEFDKVRDCAFLTVSWYRGDPVGGYRRVQLDFNVEPGDDRDPTRPLGRQLEGPWTVSVPADRLYTESAAEAHHRCHLMWQSDTILLP